MRKRPFVFHQVRVFRHCKTRVFQHFLLVWCMKIILEVLTRERQSMSCIFQVTPCHLLHGQISSLKKILERLLLRLVRRIHGQKIVTIIELLSGQMIHCFLKVRKLCTCAMRRRVIRGTQHLFLSQPKNLLLFVTVRVIRFLNTNTHHSNSHMRLLYLFLIV